MQHLVFLILTYAALVSQVSLREQIVVEGFTPELLLLVSVAAMASFEGRWALFWTALPALLADCLSPDPIGIRMAAAAVGFGVWSLCSGGGTRRSPAKIGLPTLVLLSFSFVLFITFSTESIVHLTTNSSQTITALLVQSSGNALYSMTVALLIAPGVHLARAAVPRKRETPVGGENRWTMLTN